MNECCIVCVYVSGRMLVCVHVCPHLIDTAAALRLIGSHGDCINRLWRLTFDPENTLLSIGRALSPSPHLHIFSSVYTCWHSSSCPRLVVEKENKLMIGHAFFLSLSSSFILCCILLTRALSRREETRRGPNKVFLLCLGPGDMRPLQIQEM